VSAKSRVEIYRTARVEGDINTPLLLVEEGAQLSGAIQMGQMGKMGKTGNESTRPGEALRADAAEQLRKTQGAS